MMSSLSLRVSFTLSVRTSPNRSLLSSEEPGSFATMILTITIVADPMRRMHPRISLLYRLHRGIFSFQAVKQLEEVDIMRGPDRGHRNGYPAVMDGDVEE